ncbi:hypothetical protein EV360DRAFT_76221 [Lentinula raphanica]|nr:hypothetical protein EV360DRAFT_76221 [Lentinula raphanica]
MRSRATDDVQLPLERWKTLDMPMETTSEKSQPATIKENNGSKEGLPDDEEDSSRPLPGQPQDIDAEQPLLGQINDVDDEMIFSEKGRQSPPPPQQQQQKKDVDDEMNTTVKDLQPLPDEQMNDIDDGMDTSEKDSQLLPLQQKNKDVDEERNYSETVGQKTKPLPDEQMNGIDDKINTSEKDHQPPPDERMNDTEVEHILLPPPQSRDDDDEMNTSENDVQPLPGKQMNDTEVEQQVLPPPRSKDDGNEMNIPVKDGQPLLDEQMNDIDGETNSSEKDNQPLSLQQQSKDVDEHWGNSLEKGDQQAKDVDEEMLDVEEEQQRSTEGAGSDQESSDEEPLIKNVSKGSAASLPQPSSRTKRKLKIDETTLSPLSDDSSQQDPAPEPNLRPKPIKRPRHKNSKPDVESEDEDFTAQKPSNSESTATLRRSSRITTRATTATAAALTRIKPKPVRSRTSKTKNNLDHESENLPSEDEDSEEDDVIPLFEPIAHNPHPLPASQLEYVMSIIHSQAKTDGRILDDGQPNPQWLPPITYPIREVSVNEWDVMTARQRHALYRIARGGLLIRGRAAERDKYHAENENHIERLLGDLDKSRTLHDASRTLKKPADCHTHGTLRDVREAVTLRNKVVNCLEIPLPASWVHPPEGICTQEQADAAGLSRAYKTGLSWGLFATSHAVHQFHVDCEGRGTWVVPHTGSKYWVVAVPKKESDFASTDMFGEAFEVDGHNGQQWGLYGFILEPGDMLTAYSWFHNFIAASTITNTVDHHALEGLISIATFWHHSIVIQSETYLENLEKVKNTPGWQPDDGEFFPFPVQRQEAKCLLGHDLMLHLPNFNLMEDTIQFLTLVNLVRLIPVLDVRRYREQSGRYTQATNFVVPPDFKVQTQHANLLVSDLLSWVSRNFHLHQSRGSNDTFGTNTRLKNLSRLYLCKQAQALVYEKVMAEKIGMYGEDKTITAQAVKQAIEEDIIHYSTGLQKLWPISGQGVGGSNGNEDNNRTTGEGDKSESAVEDWVMGWSKGKPQSYDWEEAVEGRKYRMVRI